MGAVRPRLPKLPKVKLTDPCQPFSKHRFELKQRNSIAGRNQYHLLFRCLHCANSVHIITKPFTIKKPKLPAKRKRAKLT